MSVRISKLDNLHIQINTKDRAYLSDVKSYFTDYVEGFRYMPRFRAGGWDGKVSMMEKGNTLPFGLLFDFLRFHKTHYKHLELNVDDNVKNFFTGVDIDPDYDLNIFPRPYQIECIDTCLKHRSGIIVAATASGKSCIISYIIKSLMDNQKIHKSLIIVPTVSLVTQFKNDMIEYGIDENLIGQVYSKIKEFDRKIVISTWQTLIKNYNRLKEFDCIMCDEVHGAKAFSVKTILSKCSNTNFRFGFTGTMPTEKIDIWNVKGYLGPVLKIFTSAELADLGFISHCKVNVINFEYNDKDKYTGDYNNIKNLVFTNPNRLKYISRTIKGIEGNILILVGKVEHEGQLLESYLKKQPNLKDREIVFIYGDTKAEDREFWRQELGNKTNIVLIATYQLFQMGINAPSLKYLMFASAFKSKIRILQSIGRTLRKHESKDHAEIYDISDQVQFLEDHAMKRRKFYISEKFEINDIDVHESIF